MDNPTSKAPSVSESMPCSLIKKYWKNKLPNKNCGEMEEGLKPPCYCDPYQRYPTHLCIWPLYFVKYYILDYHENDKYDYGAITESDYDQCSK